MAEIDRIVLMSLKPEYAHASGRAEVAAEARRVMPGVAGVLDIRVGIGAGPEAGTRSWDVSLLVRLKGPEVLDAYRDDTAHRAFVDVFLAERVEFKKAWNFTAT